MCVNHMRIIHNSVQSGKGCNHGGPDRAQSSRSANKIEKIGMVLNYSIKAVMGFIVLCQLKALAMPMQVVPYYITYIL